MSACSALLLTLHLVSHHFEYNEYMNNDNPGAGIECQQDGWSVGVGALENSYRDTSVYVVGSLRLADAGRITVDGLLGIASGYRDEAHDVGGLLPVVGTRVAYHLGLVVPALTITPAYIHATLSLSFGS